MTKKVSLRWVQVEAAIQRAHQKLDTGTEFHELSTSDQGLLTTGMLADLIERRNGNGNGGRSRRDQLKQYGGQAGLVAVIIAALKAVEAMLA